MADAEYAATRRQELSGLAATASFGVRPALAAAHRRMPRGFLWRAAINFNRSLKPSARHFAALIRR
jgi:hypothetical protein